MSFFGKNVKKIRGVKKLSQQAFADLFELKRATLGAYEEGRSEPKIDTIIKVANYFSISIDDMLTKEITVNQLLSFDGAMTTDVNQMIVNSLAFVPLVNELNVDAFVQEFLTTKSYAQAPSIKLPVAIKQNSLAFVVPDLMMATSQEGLFPGDVVIGEFIEHNNLKSGDVVIVIMRDAMFVRRFSESATHYLLKADHVNIFPLEIPLDEEVFFWKVTDVILKRYPKFISGIENKINQIMNKLSEKE